MPTEIHMFSPTCQLCKHFPGNCEPRSWLYLRHFCEQPQQKCMFLPQCAAHLCCSNALSIRAFSQVLIPNYAPLLGGRDWFYDSFLELPIFFWTVKGCSLMFFKVAATYWTWKCGCPARLVWEETQVQGYVYGHRAFAEILQNKSAPFLVTPEMPSGAILFCCQEGVREGNKDGLFSCTPWNLTQAYNSHPVRDSSVSIP